MIFITSSIPKIWGTACCYFEAFTGYINLLLMAVWLIKAVERLLIITIVLTSCNIFENFHRLLKYTCWPHLHPPRWSLSLQRDDFQRMKEKIFNPIKILGYFIVYRNLHMRFLQLFLFISVLLDKSSLP